MIKSFKNKELEKFYINGDEKGIEGVDKKRLRLVLTQLDAADELRDCKIPSFHFTKVKNDGTYSISIDNRKKLIFKLTPSEN